MRRVLSLAVLPALVFGLSACGTDSDDSAEGSAPGGNGAESSVECPPEDGVDTPVTSFSEAPPMCIDAEKTYTATMTTDAGEVTIELDARKAPETVNNFVFLARNGFYEGVVFHRVIPGFMIQGGDPTGRGSGGPGYQFDDELPEAGEYQVGSVAMANAGPNTNGSQFFIVTGDAGVGLSPDYSLFGQVTEGMETVMAIEADGSQSGAPETTHTIESVSVTEE